MVGECATLPPGCAPVQGPLPPATQNMPGVSPLLWVACEGCGPNFSRGPPLVTICAVR